MPGGVDEGLPGRGILLRSPFVLLTLCTQRDVPLVLFFDELDLLAAANPAVRDSFMGFLRAIRQSTGACAKRAVLAVVGISSYEALELDAVAGGAGNADPARGGVPVPSPWGDRVKEQHFLLPELKAVAQEYTADYGVTLPDFFIEDLFGSTHGCGRGSGGGGVADSWRRHPGLTMMALRDYHEHAVLQCGRSNGGDLPSWDSFCRTRFWETMLSNVALQTAVGAVTSSHLCRSIIERKGLLLRLGCVPLFRASESKQRTQTRPSSAARTLRRCAG